MPTYRFPYSFFPGPPTPAFPSGQLFRRLVLRLRLARGQRKLSCYALVDSGADYCAFPRSFMAPLEISSILTPAESTAGVGGLALAHFCDLRVELPEIADFPVYAAFTDGLDLAGLGLLGQTGFFDRFKVAFDLRQEFFEIET